MKNDSIQRIKNTNELKARKTLEARRHFETIDAMRANQETMLKAFKSLVEYLDQPSRVTKTSIVNHLKEINTPDSLKVMQAVKDLHETVKTHKNTDLSEVASLLKGVLAEAKLIPKSHKDISIPDPIDHTKDFKRLEDVLKAVNQSIKAQELKVEAPIVNVPETNIEAPDLTPIKEEQAKTRKELVKAIKALVFPTTDTKPMEKELKKLNKLFNEFLDSVPSGGGGGGGVVSYVNSSGIAEPVIKEADGSIPTTIKNATPIPVSGSFSSAPAKTTDAYGIQAISEDATYKYFWFEDDSANWYIMRKNLSTSVFSYTKGTGGYASVYQSAILGPSGTPTWADRGATF